MWKLTTIIVAASTLVTALAQEGLELPPGSELAVGKFQTSFRCTDRYGYFADVDNDCRVFHICQPRQVGSEKRGAARSNLMLVPRHWSFICGNQTVFNQLTLTCTHEDESIPCAASPEFFYVNDNIGHVDKNFLTDDDVARAKALLLNHAHAGFASSTNQPPRSNHVGVVRPLATSSTSALPIRGVARTSPAGSADSSGRRHSAASNIVATDLTTGPSGTPSTRHASSAAGSSIMKPQQRVVKVLTRIRARPLSSTSSQAPVMASEARNSTRSSATVADSGSASTISTSTTKTTILAEEKSTSGETPTISSNNNNRGKNNTHNNSSTNSDDNRTSNGTTRATNSSVVTTMGVASIPTTSRPMNRTEQLIEKRANPVEINPDPSVNQVVFVETTTKHDSVLSGNVSTTAQQH